MDSSELKKNLNQRGCLKCPTPPLRYPQLWNAESAKPTSKLTNTYNMKKTMKVVIERKTLKRKKIKQINTQWDIWNSKTDLEVQQWGRRSQEFGCKIIFSYWFCLFAQQAKRLPLQNKSNINNLKRKEETIKTPHFSSNNIIYSPDYHINILSVKNHVSQDKMQAFLSQHRWSRFSLYFSVLCFKHLYPLSNCHAKGETLLAASVMIQFTLENKNF